MHLADALAERVSKTSPVCVGIDPQVNKLPEKLSRDARGVQEFCIGIIDAIAEVASCAKLNLAFFEVLGWEGMKIFWELCVHAKHRGLLVIADGKRNDIGSTCEAYADAYLSADSPIDAITVNPYLGSDSVKPFLERCSKNDKGIFVLVKTSNPSSGEIQDLPVGDEVVHEHLAQLVESWGTQYLGKNQMSCVGAVVGATYPEELKYLRTLMPHVPLLIPGYGTQGGTAENAKFAFIKGSMGAVVSSSRGIIYASSEKDWKEAAQKAAETMAKEIEAVLI